MAGPFLRRRGGAYRLRVRVPSDLVQKIGRVEVGRSLATSCPRAARARAALLNARLSEAWYRIRDMPDEDATPEKLIALLEETLALQEHAAEQIARRDKMAVELAELRGAVALVDQAEANSERLATMIEGAGRLMTGVERVGRRIKQERAAGKLSGESLQVLHQMLDAAGVVMRDRPTPRALEFLDGTFILEKRLQEDARRHMEGYVRLFAKVLGDRPLGTYTRKDVLEWVGVLEKVRTSYGKGGKDAAKPIAAIIKESRGKPTLSMTTVQKHVTHLRAFFLTAARHHRFATADDVDAMFTDIRLSASVPKPRKRGIWQVKQLRVLLSSPTWTGTRSRPADFTKRYEPGPHVHIDAYWWLPVLALHTGARLEELAQLQHADLLSDSDGVTFLAITGEGERRVKNAHSVRAVPLHPLLVELGFPRLFHPGRKGRVFAELKAAGRPPKWGGQYSEDFTAYRREVGLYDSDSKWPLRGMGFVLA